MYIYTHRRWSKKSPVYDNSIIKFPYPLNPYQQKDFINDGRVKLFLGIDIDWWYSSRNVGYGPHTWILKNPNELPKISKPLISFAEYYYRETSELLEKTKHYNFSKDEYRYPLNLGMSWGYNEGTYKRNKILYYKYGEIDELGRTKSPTEFFNLSQSTIKRYLETDDMENFAGMWEDEYFVDAVRIEFGAVGFKIKNGVVITNPNDVDMEYYFDYDKKIFNNDNEIEDDEMEDDEIGDNYIRIILSHEYRNKKIEDQKLLNILSRISPG